MTLTIEWIACKNCMINLKTGKTALSDPSEVYEYDIPTCHYDPKNRRNTVTRRKSDVFVFQNDKIGTKPNVLLLKEIIKSSPCPAITKFLYDIMTPADVEPPLLFMTYSLWRNYKFHNWILLVGYGQNRKSAHSNTIRNVLSYVFSRKS